jgi:hypothetical protein
MRSPIHTKDGTPRPSHKLRICTCCRAVLLMQAQRSRNSRGWWRIDLHVPGLTNVFTFVHAYLLVNSQVTGVRFI